MKKKWWVFFITGLLIVGCLATHLSASPREKVSKCYPPSKEFSERDLTGTWVAGWSGHTDTLIIKADKTYRQVIHVEFDNKPSTDYESNWQPWHIEFSEDNIPYLHLDNMRFCGINSEISCDKRTGGGYDFCRDSSIKMVNEGVLLVLSTSEDLPKETNIPQSFTYLHYPLGSENSWIYSKK